MSALFKMFRQSLNTALCVVLALIALAPAAQAARETTYYHTDGLGSVVAASNQAGELLWRKDYAPFGDQIDQTPDTEKLGYTGKPHDSLLGLTNLGARYYDPHLGRFMSPDPVGFVESNPMSFNRYAYVNNNPYKYVDPDGEFLNFAAKFVLDVGVNIAINYVTTGEMNVGGALKESAVGILNPAKTVASIGRLGMALSKGAKKLDKLNPCPLSCFVAGTTVLAESGYVPIEKLNEGDLVWAHDPETGETALKPIVRTFVNTNDSVWQLTIEKEGVRYLHEVTGSHPYYVVDQGWIEVAELQVGAILLTEGGATARVTSLRDTGRILTTYNFEVADIHTYYVSAAKVLVHNCNKVIPGRGYHVETISPTPVRSADVTDKWDEFLGAGAHSNIHPRTGLPDKDRIVSSDGKRSIRYGSHEMNSSPTKHHYHEETWTLDSAKNAMNVDNKIVRIKK